MKRLIATLVVAAGLAVPQVASADTVAAFNGCVYRGATYMDVVQQWWDAGSPSCGPGYVLSVSTTTTVGSTVGGTP